MAHGICGQSWYSFLMPRRRHGLLAGAALAARPLYRFKTRRMACDLGIDEISYAAR